MATCGRSSPLLPAARGLGRQKKGAVGLGDETHRVVLAYLLLLDPFLGQSDDVGRASGQLDFSYLHGIDPQGTGGTGREIISDMGIGNK